MRVRTILASFLVAVLGCGSVSAYTLVRKGGRRMHIRQAPEIKDGTVYCILKNGLFCYMDESEIDRAATEKANGHRTGHARGKASPPASAAPRVYTNDDLRPAEAAAEAPKP